MKNRFVGAALAALFGHLAGFPVLTILSLVGVRLENPSGAVLPAALVSFGMGAVVTALVARKNQVGAFGCFTSGCLFALPPFVASFFGKGEIFSWGIRFLMVGIAILLVMTLSLAFPKRKSRKHRRKHPYAARQRGF